VELSSRVLVSALAAVNAVGDVVNPATGKIVAGARTAPDSRDFANTAEHFLRGAPAGPPPGQNTTLVVVATNARLTKPMTNKLAEFGSAGVARAIRPVWTMYDGDLVMALSTGDRQADINLLGIAAAEAVARCIVRAVESAPTLGGIPGLKS
jgi:L-aminopeptidase/D-esterase-like protein